MTKYIFLIQHSIASGEKGYPCLGSDIEGKTFSFLALNMMLAIGFHIHVLC